MYIINSVKPNSLIGIAYDFDDVLNMLSELIFKRKTDNGCSMFNINTFLSIFWYENNKCDYRSELVDYMKENDDMKRKIAQLENS